MSSARSAVLIIAAIAVVSIIGTGLAASYGSFLETSSNTVNYSGTGINILYEESEDNWEPLGTALVVNGPAYTIVGDTVTFTSSTVTIDTYRLDVDCATTGDVRCWMVLDDPLSWAVVDTATIKIDSGSPQTLIDSGSAAGTETRLQSTVPVTFSSLTKGQHTFEFVITYKNITIDLSDGDSGKVNSISDLADSRLVFELK